MKYCAGETCLVFAQLHPIFNYDATRLYSEFQYYWLDKFSSVKDDAESKNIAQAIINLRPAVVVCRFKKRYFLLDLFLKEIISKEDFENLNSLFKKNYTLEVIGYGVYYIRKDKL